MDKIAGIDFGARTAGTTVVSLVLAGKVQLFQCPKGSDADQFILTILDRGKPNQVYLDAPLSLPGVYQGLAGCEDYFYRACDRELSAMSPMFLGGLTARAMQLRKKLEDGGMKVFETYPAQLTRLLELDQTTYKDSIDGLPSLLYAVRPHLTFTLESEPTNWHQFDALLATISGWRHKKGEARQYGHEGEGVILV